MKRLSIILAILTVFALLGPAISHADVWVNGYYRSNGTYVNGYYRSSPDGNPYNNYSYPGNYNPYTGKIAPGNPDTYLKNYYGPTGGSYGSYSPSIPATPSYQVVNGGYMLGSVLFCNSGYYQQGNSCIKAPDHGSAYGGSTFYCDYGYTKIGDSCFAPAHGQYIGSLLYCDSGYVVNGGQCITNTQDCINTFGSNVNGVPGPNSNSSCYCNAGYQWNTSQTACVSNFQFNSDALLKAQLQAQVAALLLQLQQLQQQAAARR